MNRNPSDSAKEQTVLLAPSFDDLICLRNPLKIDNRIRVIEILCYLHSLTVSRTINDISV